MEAITHARTPDLTIRSGRLAGTTSTTTVTSAMSSASGDSCDDAILGIKINMDYLSLIAIDNEIRRHFEDSSLVQSGQPTAVILMGDVASGKTHLRAKKYSQGFVLIDAAEIFHHLSGTEQLDFPDALLGPLEVIGPLIALRALSERRNIVTEVIGDDEEPTIELITALKQAGYSVNVVGVTCDLEEAIRRNENRGDSISAYFAEPFQRKWIIGACRQLGSAAVAP